MSNQDRIAYGYERWWNGAAPETCEDCCVSMGDVHQAGCATEECPRCGNDYLTCGCDLGLWEGAEGYRG